MSEILEQQYEYIRRTREILLSFLEEIPVQKLHETVPGFGHGCILRTHIHVIDCYRRWLGSFAFHERWADFRDTADDDIKHYDVKRFATDLRKSMTSFRSSSMNSMIVGSRVSRMRSDGWIKH